jgi:hypothetical protein
MRSSPLADRGVAGSLAVLTRTIDTVTGAALLTLLFHAAQTSDTAEGFLAAFDTVFRIVGVAVVASVVAIPWWRPSATRQRRARRRRIAAISWLGRLSAPGELLEDAAVAP